MSLLLLIALLVMVLVPTVTYLLRARDVPDYSDISPQATITYLIRYDSGDGIVNDSECTLILADTGTVRGSESCIHVVTAIDPCPERKFNASLLGTARARVGAIEVWRSEGDMRILYAESMLVNAPLVNTMVTRTTYSGYEGYPGWPYRLGDSWTYDRSSDPDTFLQGEWTDSLHAEVVADDVVLNIGDMEYVCLKVVHTLVDTSLGTPSGAGVGSTLVEFWPKDCRSIAPIRTENNTAFRGTETWTMVDADPWPAASASPGSPSGVQ